MRQTDEFEDHSGGLPIIYMALGVSAFILAVLAIVIHNNKKPEHAAVIPVEETTSEEQTVSTSGLTADDLDIWDMYPEEETGTAVADDKKENSDQEKEEETTTEEDDKDDGKHIYIEYHDGSSEWVNINPYLPKHDYDFTGLVSTDGRLKYYSGGKQISSLGVDISRYQSGVDFQKVRQDGIDYVMLRVGARGYKTGELKLDENFADNLKKATEAGLQVGLYLYSQAVTVEEAAAEAQFILDQIGEYKITYPIAIDMEFVDNDSARVESLTRDERTAVTSAFVNKIREARYTPMIYGDTEWLVKRIDLAKFSDCCIWLSEEKDIPKYPYQFDMWEYTQKGEVDGIDGYVNLNISFIDYSAR